MDLLNYEECKKLANSVHFPTNAVIDGKNTDALSRQTYETQNPATGKSIAPIAKCGESDVNFAVSAARAAFEDGRWSKLAPSERKKTLSRLADLIIKNGNELAILESIDSGKPVYDTFQVDIPETVECFRWHGEAADKLEDAITATGPQNVSMVVREPIGVIGAILPWNFPILMAGWKIAPILAAGNCVVAKPSTLTSFTLIKLAQLALEAGVPAGVFNVVTGGGRSVGEAMAMHNDIDMLTFTGSTEVGRKLLEYSGRSNLKRVLLELGGKNPCLVFPEIDNIDAVAEEIVTAALWNMGENCTANSRILIHKDIKNKLTDKIIENVKKWKTGDPLNRDNRLGAIIEKPHMEKILEYVEIGKKEGADLIFGGMRILEETGGYFIDPAVFDNVQPNMTIAREEIFGPVFALMTFENEEEAVRLANDTEYGLQATLMSDDFNRVHRVSRMLRAGTVSVNCYSEGDIGTPFGGFKQSGFFGRDKSLWANRQYTEMKTIWMQTK